MVSEEDVAEPNIQTPKISNQGFHFPDSSHLHGAKGQIQCEQK